MRTLARTYVRLPQSRMRAYLNTLNQKNAGNRRFLPFSRVFLYKYMIFLMLEFLTYSPVRQKTAISAVFPYNGNYVFQVQNTRFIAMQKPYQPFLYIYTKKFYWFSQKCLYRKIEPHFSLKIKNRKR